MIIRTDKSLTLAIYKKKKQKVQGKIETLNTDYIQGRHVHQSIKSIRLINHIFKKMLYKHPVNESQSNL